MSHGIRIWSRKLKALRPVLAKWIALNARLGKEWSPFKDAPWWHIERALVSLFAGAVWRCGGDAFEEYAEDKRGKRNRTSGRIDLWFSLHDTNFKVEAKQCWVRSHHDAKALAHVVEVMGRAKRDAGNLDPDGMCRLAIVFGAVLVPKRHLPTLQIQIASAVKLATHKKIPADAVAWVFPKLNRPLASSDGYVLPGIIVWMKVVQRSRAK